MYKQIPTLNSNINLYPIHKRNEIVTRTSFAWNINRVCLSYFSRLAIGLNASSVQQCIQKSGKSKRRENLHTAVINLSDTTDIFEISAQGEKCTIFILIIFRIRTCNLKENTCWLRVEIGQFIYAKKVNKHWHVSAPILFVWVTSAWEFAYIYVCYVLTLASLTYC